MSDAQELKPCPFCGGAAWINDYEAKHGAMPARSRCPQCKSCGCSLGYHPTESKAIAAWNRRADLVSAPSVTVNLLEWSSEGTWCDQPVIYADCAFGCLMIVDHSRHGNGIQYYDVTGENGTQSVYEDIEAAKAAAQADYEARIMASIQIAPAPGWQTIKSAPVGIPVLAYCYGGEVLMTRITKHGEDEYARNPDLWMPIPKPPTKDSTHD